MAQTWHESPRKAKSRVDQGTGASVSGHPAMGFEQSASSAEVQLSLFTRSPSSPNLSVCFRVGDKNGEYDYSKVAHLCLLFPDIPSPAKNYKIAPVLTVYVNTVE